MGAVLSQFKLGLFYSEKEEQERELAVTSCSGGEIRDDVSGILIECPRTPTSRPQHKELEYMVNVVSCLRERKMNYLVSDIGTMGEPSREKMTQPPTVSLDKFKQGVGVKSKIL